MTIAKRAFFLIVSIIIFLILVPVFILGIQGYTYDFSRHRLVKTGMIIAKSEPSNAHLSIEGNGKVREGSTPAAVRFLYPSDYNVTISKDGYFTWKKRFTVRGGVVTFAFNTNDKVVLLPKEPKQVDTLAKYEPVKKEKPTHFTYDFEPGSVPGTVNLVGYPNNSLADKIVLTQNLPQRDNAQIVPGRNGLVFLVVDRILYQVTDKLDYIAEGVSFAEWNNDLSKLVYGNAHELNLYNPFDPGSNQRELLVRTSEVGGDFCIVPGIGYVLREYQNTVRAIELDGRNDRNTYDLFMGEQPLSIADCDKDGKKIVIQQPDGYKIYNLRD